MAHNAGGRLIGGERFEVTEIFAGTAIGVFEGKTDEQIVALDKAVAEKIGVEAITEDEYKTALQKKTGSLTSLPHSNLSPGPQVSLASRVGVVVAEPVLPDLSEQNKLESVKGALESTGKVEPAPKPEETPNPKKK